MNKIKTFWNEKILNAFSTKQAKTGGYNVILTVIVLAILIVFNLFVSVIPSKYTELDMTSTKLYSITSETKAVLTHLDEDVTIYWLTQTGEENIVIEKMLGKYESENSHITVKKINPDIYPTFADNYTSETIENNDLIVECGEKSKYLSIEDLYETSYSYSSYTSYYSAFDGEQKVTSAISYVTNDEFPTIYLLTGHSEDELSDDMRELFSDNNIDIVDFSLLTASEIPEECDMILLNAPNSDISEIEKDMLLDYVSNGGKLMILCGPEDSNEFTNIYTLMENYGVSIKDGIVIENDSNYYAYGYVYLLIPELISSEITDSQIESNDNLLVSIASGAKIDNVNSDYEVTSIMDTSDDCYSKIAGYDLTTYDYEEGDIYGPFSLACSIVDDSNGEEGKIVWVGSSYILDDTYDSYSSNANSRFVLNAFYYMNDDVESTVIPSKSLSYTYLTISDSEAGRIKLIILLLVPLAFLVMGIFSFVERRKL